MSHQSFVYKNNKSHLIEYLNFLSQNVLEEP